APERAPERSSLCEPSSKRIDAWFAGKSASAASVTARSDSSSGRLSVSFAVSASSALIASFVLRREGARFFCGDFGLRARFFIAHGVYVGFVDQALRVDVAIIGGGVVGLACATALARAGKSTVTLERHRAL